jgi:ERCC4-related helicase
MLENILLQPDCHLIYSNFRTIEGIGLFRLALLYHGYKELRIVKNRIEIYSMFEQQDYIEDKNDHRYFSLFTGTEDVEQKEILLNIYNNRFKNLPKITQDDLKKHFGYLDLEKTGNIHGEIIKVLMITASGAEGIDMKNTRFVHIMEPYWHHVRINQVIGRARRICSHMDLPKDLQDVTVYLYLTILGKDVLESEQYNELKNADKGESTDQRLYSIMLNKERLSERFLDVLKRTSIDCANNYRKKCFSYPKQHPKGQSTSLITTVDYHDAAGVRISTKE